MIRNGYDILGRVLVVWVFVGLGSGCIARVSESHYFASVGKRGDRPVNFFRIQVEADGGFSAARYISGYYDERAVDLYFNELKSTRPGGTTETLIRPIISSDTLPATGTESGATAKIVALNPGADNGAFVMIFSTNANSVANAIGNFAESEAVADAITNLVNRDLIRAKKKSDAELAVTKSRTGATGQELEKLFEQEKTVPATDPAEVQNAYVRILNAISAALGGPRNFTSLKDADDWFRIERGG